MRVVCGRSGVLFAVSDPAPFGAVLTDVGDGFDWVAPDAYALWLGEPTFDVFEDGEWLQLEPLTVDSDCGHVGFSRCLRGKVVRARGQCRPLSVVATCGRWEIVAPIDGSVKHAHPHDCAPEFPTVGPLYARLFFSVGAYVGVCQPELNDGLTFEEGAPRYARTNRPPEGED